MSDLWSPVEGASLASNHPSLSHGQEVTLHRIVDRVLQHELELVRDHSPQAQLGVSVDANEAMIRGAYEARRARVDPSAFRQFGPSTVVMAQEITNALRAACEELCARASLRRRATFPPSRSNWFSRWFGRPGIVQR